MYVAGYRDSDVEEQAELAWGLQDDLLELEVGDISRPLGGAPAGAKGAGLEWAQLVVTVVGGLPPLMTAIHSWLNRHPGAMVTVEIDGDKVTLSDPSDLEKRALMQTWMQRHGE